MNLMVWFSKTKTYIHRPWIYLHKQGYLERYETISHYAIFTKQVLRYLKMYIATYNWKWLVSIPPYFPSIYPIVLASAIGKESIYYISYPYWDDPMFKPLTPLDKKIWGGYLRSNSNKVITTTKAASDSLKKEHDVSNIMIIPHAVDTELFRPKRVRKPTSPVILFVGKMVEQKGVNILIDIATRNKDLEFWFVGDGPLRDNVKAAAEKYPNIFYWGYIEDEERLVEIYNKASLLVLPTWTELFGSVLIEALSCGTPVISTDCPGPREIVTNEVGRIVPRKNTERLEEAIIQMVSDQGMLKEMGERGRERAKEKYDVRIVAQKWLDVLT